MSLVAPGHRGGRVPAWRSHVPGLLLLLVLFLGGGAGSRYPLIALAAQLIALALIAGAGVTQGAERRLALAFGAAGLLLLLQLVPLPPALWHALPGRDTAAGIDALLGHERWRPLSMTPDATLSALLALAVPLGAALATASLAERRRMMLLRLIVAAAAAGTVFAALQVAAGADAPVLYRTAHRGFGVGFFVNRNHQAALLLVGIVLAAVPGVLGRGTAQRATVPAAILLLALGVLATSSRTGLLLLPPALMVAAALVAGVRRSAKVLLAGGALYLLAGLLLSRTQLVQRVFARFASVGEEKRYEYWENTLYAAREALPWGTGIGSFERVYRTVEPLGQVSPLGVNHAHAEPLELLLEGGVPAIVLVVGGLVALGWALRARWRGARGRGERATVAAAGSGIALILLFSLVDYPLRMPAIAGLFGVLLGLLAAPPAAVTRRVAAPRRTWLAGAAVLVGVLAIADGLGAFLVLNGQSAAATTVAPWSAQAWSALADREQLAGRAAPARTAAARALAIVPVDAAALRAHGSADVALGATARGGALLDAAAALGWRDTLTQLWLIARAREAGDMTVAAERIDALLRRGRFGDAMLTQLRAVYQTPGGPEAIAVRLTDRPSWRQGFLNAIADDAAADVPRVLGLLARLRAAGVPATPGETMLIRWRLADRGDMAGARSIWRASGGRGEVADGGFEQLKAPLPSGAVPYGWGAQDVAGLRVVPMDRGAHGSRRAVRIVSDGVSTGTALVQAIALAPGRYRVEASWRSEGAAGSLTLSCAGDARPAIVTLAPTADPASGWQRVASVATVPAGCPVQLLGIGVRGGSGEAGAFWVDAIRITPVRDE